MILLCVILAGSVFFTKDVNAASFSNTQREYINVLSKLDVYKRQDYISVTDVYRAGGVSLDKITVTEGGSRSDLWNQIKADMLNSTVTTLKKAGGAVMTNVVVAAYAVGDIDNLKDSFNSWLEVKKVYTPDPENTKYYRSIYNMQNKLVREDMKPTFDTVSYTHLDVYKRQVQEL